MWRIIPTILLLIMLIFPVSCCSRYDSTRPIVDAYAAESGSSGRVYGSYAEEGEVGYMSPDLRFAMFGDGELPPDFTLLVHSRLDAVTELGVFRADSGDESLRLTELASKRLMLLGELADGDGEVTVTDNLVIYYFGKNPDLMKEILLKILK